MPFVTYPQLPLAPGASVASNTFTSAQGLPLGEVATWTPQFPATTLVVGTCIDIMAWGVASNTATPTLALGVYWNGTISAAVGGTTIKVSAAKTTTTAMSNWQWAVEFHARIDKLGTSGEIIGWGRWFLPTSLTAWSEFNLDESAPAAVTVDTTGTKNLVIGATWGASSSSNTITMHACSVQISSPL